MEFLINNYLTYFAIFCAAAVAYALKKIDFIGAAAGVLVASLIFYAGSIESLLALLIFFTVGSAASSWKRETKQKYKVAQENEGRRGISNVLGNGGAAVLFALVSIVFSISPDKAVIMITASFATACSDTMSSELGTVFGKKFVSVISFKPSVRGKDGAISLEGLLSGLIGSMLVASVVMLSRNRIELFLLVSAAGLFGNIADSVLGAAMQNKGLLNNHQVNFFATLIGGITALLFYNFF